MLFTIGEAIAADSHLAHQQRMGGETVADDIDGERDVCRSTSLEGDGLGPFTHHSIRLSIEQTQAGLTREAFLSQTMDAGSHHRLVTITQEARHVGLDHHLLLGNGRSLDAAVRHILRMSHTEETPGGETFGQRELNGYATLFIGGELGIEEGGLVEVLAYLHLLCLLRSWFFLLRISGGISIGSHHPLLIQHR